jgi:uncharacterized protein (UPF0332 family)
MEKRQEIIKYRHDRAFEVLIEAKALIGLGFWNTAINRIYYGCYYMVIALLYQKQLPTHTHKGVRVLFALHFVKEELVSKEDGHFFSTLYDSRQDSDYEDFVTNDIETATDLLRKAEIFVKKLSKLLNTQP